MTEEEYDEMTQEFEEHMRFQTELIQAAVDVLEGSAIPEASGTITANHVQMISAKSLKELFKALPLRTQRRMTMLSEALWTIEDDPA